MAIPESADHDCSGESESAEDLALVHAMHSDIGCSRSFNAKWESILDRLRQRVQAHVGALSTYCFASGEGSVLCESPWDAGFAVDYSERFCVRNPWFLSSDSFVAGRVLVDTELIDAAQLEKTDFYRNYLQPNDLRHWLCGVVARHGDTVLYLEFLRQHKQLAFSYNARKKMGSLLEHAQLAINNHWHCRHTEDLCDILRCVTERTARAIFLVDRHAALLHGNEASSRLLSEFDGMQLKNGCLSSALTIHHRALRDAIRSVADGRERASEAIVNVTLPGSNPDETAIVQIHYAGELCSADTGQSVSAVAVSTRSPVRRHDPARCLFANLYELTPAQSRLSALVFSGYTLHDAAVHLNVSENTLRSHLKQIYAKTNTHGQMEMVHLHARTCAEEF